MVKIVDGSRMKKMESVLLVLLIVASGFVVIFSFSAPHVKAQVYHLERASLEDNDPAYDMNNASGIVEWDPAEDHYIDHMSGSYIVDAGYTLIIPGGVNVMFDGLGQRIEVEGTLKTTDDGDAFTSTTFMYNGFGAWDSIFVRSGGELALQDATFQDAMRGVNMEPGSSLINPGIEYVTFIDFGLSCVDMDGVKGFTRIRAVTFDDSANPSGTAISIQNGFLNITDTPTFLSHGIDKPFIYMRNANVRIEGVGLGGSGFFNCQNQQGPAIVIDEGCNDTYLEGCTFLNGYPGDHYIEVEGSSPLFESCSFETDTSGVLSVIAIDNETGIPAHPIVLQPTQDTNPGIGDDTFDNSTINASGSSSVTLKWGVLVRVIDTFSNPLPNSVAWVVNRNDDPAEPPSRITDSVGEAGFIVTELIQYEGFRDIFNPFNISAENNSVFGYANDENSTVTFSRISIVVIGGLPFPNDPPIVSYIETPDGVQSGLVSIDYILLDPNPGDNGYLSIEVYFSTDNKTWFPATIDVSSDPLSGLYNNTFYIIVWDSADPNDLPGIYNETVRIKIIPFDKHGSGTPGITGFFTVDNAGPPPPSPPFDITAMLSPLAAEDVKIFWNASPDDGGGENDVVGYTVYRSTTGVNGTYSPEAWIPANGSSYYMHIDYGAGDGDWNNYFYMIRANDTLGNEEQNNYKAGKFAHSLTLRWNVFSVPLIQLLDTEGYVLRTIDGNYLVLKGYHAGKSRPWRNKHFLKPHDLNDVITMDHQSGYYIRMTASDHLVTAGSVPEGTMISLKAGWNLVGFPCLESKTVDEALSSISGSYNKVEFFNTTTQNEERLDATDLMHPGQGYWIHATADCVWEVPV
jgi:hypothetical protein